MMDFTDADQTTVPPAPFYDAAKRLENRSVLAADRERSERSRVRR